MRFITEKHQELIKSLDDLVANLVGDQLESKKIKGNLSLQKAKDLKSALSEHDAPSWLMPLIEVLGCFSSGQWRPPELIIHLIRNIEIIRGHKWVFDNPSESAFDFDSIFEHYKSESKLPELFEEIIKILEDIQDSGEVDSVAMMTALGKVISTLKRNKNGSYFSINSAWSFLISFLKNYMWAELAKVPLLGTAMGALEKTINETNKEMFKVHSEVQSEMKRVVEAEVKVLQKKTDFKFASYDMNGNEILGLEYNPAVDENV
jgi:hypothetical protein